MNHAPQYAIGQEVVTPRHGAGVIKWVYPAPKVRARNRYSVAVLGRREALLLDEVELQPQQAGTSEPGVRCLDCSQNKSGRFSTFLCPTVNKYRKVQQPRQCAQFTPRPPTEGA